jgi:hypothetical protein
MTLEHKDDALRKEIWEIKKTASNETVSEKIKSGRKIINKTIADREAFARLR